MDPLDSAAIVPKAAGRIPATPAAPSPAAVPAPAGFEPEPLPPVPLPSVIEATGWVELTAEAAPDEPLHATSEPANSKDAPPITRAFDQLRDCRTVEVRE